MAALVGTLLLASPAWAQPVPAECYPPQEPPLPQCQGVGPTEIERTPTPQPEDREAPAEVSRGAERQQAGLAATGFDLTAGAVLVVGLLAAGGAMVVVARRRATAK